MTLPIPTSPGRSGFGPTLSLGYDSGRGNGPFGFGWSLSLPAITRKTDKGLPRYHDAIDVFLLSGAEDLVPVLDGAEAGQRSELDRRRRTPPATASTATGPGSRGCSPGSSGGPAADGDMHWRSMTRDNVTTVRRGRRLAGSPTPPTRRGSSAG